jgi:hypothetical protein
VNNQIANPVRIGVEFANRVMKSVKPIADPARTAKIELAERVMPNIKMLGDIRDIIELKIIMERREIKEDRNGSKRKGDKGVLPPSARARTRSRVSAFRTCDMTI